jgi:hypothetical protein
MEQWWECRSCGIPNDPRYGSCVSCGGAAVAAQQRRSANSPLVTERRSILEQRFGSQSSLSPLLPPASTSSRQSFAFSSPPVMTPSLQRQMEWNRSVIGDDEEGAAAVLSLVSMMSPRRSGGAERFVSKGGGGAERFASKGGDAVASVIADLLRQGTPQKPSLTLSLGEDRRETTARDSRRGSVVRSSPNAGQAQTTTPGASNVGYASTVDTFDLPFDVAGVLTAMQNHYNERIEHGGEGSDHDGPPQRIMHAPTVRSNAKNKSASPLRQPLGSVAFATDTTTAETIARLRAQLSDALIEAQAAREGGQRSAALKDRELAAARRELDHWKDQTMASQKQNHQLILELQRTNERNEVMAVQLGRLRVEADQRVPNLVAQEFRLRLDTALEARAASLQALHAALGLLAMSIGDGLTRKYVSHTLDSAALLHSNTVLSLQARVAELEAKLPHAGNSPMALSSDATASE